MRIILANRFLYPDEVATSRMMSSLAFGLAARGHAVDAVASRQRHDGGAEFTPRETVNSVRFHRVATARFGGARLMGRAADYLTYHLSAGWRIWRLAKPGDVVIVGTDPPLFSVTAALALAGTRASLVNWMLDLFPEAAIRLGLLRPGSPLSRLLCRLRDMSLRRARLNVAPIERMAELLMARGISPESIVVMHQWSDGGAIQPINPAENALRREWGLQDKFVVGYSGNFGRVHEFGTMLAAAERLRDRADIAFLFVGGGQRHAWVEAEIRRRNLTNVLMKPLQPRERLGNTLCAADAHLVSLIPELEPCSVPSKFYGILAAGRPTLFVGDPDGEIARVIARTGCGAAVRIGEDAVLAAHILNLAGSAAQRAQMGTAARRTFDAEFREAVGISVWQGLLSELAAPKLHLRGEASGVPVSS
ncbi:MAG: glycosyltransferase family 4 protein [Acetobacteraceae bacterium]|nr:glycosyltransferase family 4 protein [Acetobacteraceae bacterium]